MKVGDENLGLTELLKVAGRQKVALDVVVVRVIRQKDTEAVTDGDPGGHHQERVRKPPVLTVGQPVEGLPRDEHGHEDRLAAARSHLEGDAIEPGVGFLVGLANLVLDPGVPGFSSDLRQIDGGLHCLDLAEEQLVLTVRVSPVFEQPTCGSGGSWRVIPFTPELHTGTDSVDGVVFFKAILRPLGVKLELLAPLLGPRNRNEVPTGPPSLDDLVGDTLVGEPEMAQRFHKGRIDDRVLNDHLSHAVPFSLVNRPLTLNNVEGYKSVRGLSRML